MEMENLSVVAAVFARSERAKAQLATCCTAAVMFNKEVVCQGMQTGTT